MVYKIDPTQHNGGKIVVNPTFLLLVDARHHHIQKKSTYCTSCRGIKQAAADAKKVFWSD